MLDLDDVRISRGDPVIDNRIATLRVGAQPMRDFTIHEAILTADSPFFSTALDRKWREGRCRIIDLPEDEADVVAAYVHFLYFRKIASKPVTPPDFSIDDGEYYFLAQLYTFGEKVQADLFCDAVIDAMVSKTDDIASDGTRTFPSHAAIVALYNGTPLGSPVRRFVVDMYAQFGDEKWIPMEAGFSHAEFLTDLVRALLSRSQTGTPHKQINFPRRRRWHKRGGSEEFLQLAMTSRERIRIGEAD